MSHHRDQRQAKALACINRHGRGASLKAFLIPRWVGGTRRGFLYDVLSEGELVVVGSADPEHDFARTMLRRGLVGTAETIDATTGVARMKFDIASFAGTRTVEREGGSITTEAWRPYPSPRSRVGTKDAFSARGGAGLPADPVAQSWRAPR